jgi:hypothetical protein
MMIAVPREFDAARGEKSKSRCRTTDEGKDSRGWSCRTDEFGRSGKAVLSPKSLPTSWVCFGQDGPDTGA